MKTLVLNADFQPMAIRPSNRVMHRNSFRPVKYHKRAIRDSAGREHKIPSVVVCGRYVKTIYKPAKFSKRAVYIRDSFVCQYSGQQYPAAELTVDHVIPKSRGGKSVFENTVVCHRDINRTKGDRTPEEAGLSLIRRPRAVNVQDLLVMKILAFSDIPDDWKEYV